MRFAKKNKWKDWGGLFNRKRFEWLKKQRFKELRGLTIEKAIELEENFLSSSFVEELKNNFLPTNPVCLKLSLRKRKLKKEK